MFQWANQAGEQGTVGVDVEGRVVFDVDDPYYSGVISREESIALARAVLDCNTVPRPVEPERGDG